MKSCRQVPSVQMLRRNAFSRACSTSQLTDVVFKLLIFPLQEMIDEADRDGDGEVNEEEFFRIMKKTSLF